MKTALYGLAKLLEGFAMAYLAAGFLVAFPKLMSPRAFFIGLGIFAGGWMLERFARNT
jgi:hypothetical protein